MDHNIVNYEGDVWDYLKKESGYSTEIFNKKFSNFNERLNLSIRDSLIDIFKSDQEVNKTKDAKKIDSFDRIHEKFHIRMIKK